MLASTTYPSPRNRLMVRAFAGDSTITREKPLFLLDLTVIKIGGNVKMGSSVRVSPEIIALIYTH